MLIIERKDGSLYLRANSVLGKYNKDEQRFMSGQKLYQIVPIKGRSKTKQRFMRKAIAFSLLSEEFQAKTDNPVLTIESKKEAS